MGRGQGGQTQGEDAGVGRDVGRKGRDVIFVKYLPTEGHWEMLYICHPRSFLQ